MRDKENFYSNGCLDYCTVKVKSVPEPSGTPCRSLSQFLLRKSDQEYHYPPPLLDGCQSIARIPPPPPAFQQASLKDCRYPFIFLDGERHCERYLFCPRTQHIDPATGPVPGTLDPVQRINHKATACPALNIMTDTQKESSHVKTDN